MPIATGSMYSSYTDYVGQNEGLFHLAPWAMPRVGGKVLLHEYGKNWTLTIFDPKYYKVRIALLACSRDMPGFCKSGHNYQID